MGFLRKNKTRLVNMKAAQSAVFLLLIVGFFVFIKADLVNAKDFNFGVTGDRIFLNGNVGIGTTGPNALLEVGGASITRDIFFGPSNGAASNTTYHHIGYATAANWHVTGSGVGDLTIGAKPTGGIVFGTNDSVATPLARMYIANTGNVGIGTTNPEFKLDVNGDIAFPRTSKLMFSGPTVGDRSRSYFTGDGNNDIFVYGPSSNLIATFGYTGNVGIGTTGPNYKLDVNGSLNATSAYINGNQISSPIAYGTSCSGARWIKLGTLTIPQGGADASIKIKAQVGYNASIDQNYEAYISFKTSNTASVDAYGFGGDSSFYETGRNSGIPADGVRWVSNVGGAGATIFDLYINFPTCMGSPYYTVESSFGSWVNNGGVVSDPGGGSATVLVATREFNIGANSLVVSSGGNVGINTINPGVKLDVSGAARATAFNISTLGAGCLCSDASGNVYVCSCATGGTSQWTTNGTSIYYNSGNVGIGVTSPAQKLDIAGNIKLSSNKLLLDYAGSNPASGPSIQWTDGTYANDIGLYINGGLIFQGNSGNPAFKVLTPTTNGTLGTEVVHLGGASTSDNSWFNGGNVGIGTIAPGYPLDVNGQMRAERYRGINSLVLNTYATVNPSSNVYLYSSPNDRDSWLFLDSADTGSNWGIYHRQIDSAVSGLPANSIGFVGGGASVLQAYISLANGGAYFNGNVGIGLANPGVKLDVNGAVRATAMTDTTLGTGNICTDSSGNFYVCSIGTNFWSGTRNGTIWNGDSGAGNVGIGITTPGSKLTVQQSIDTDGIRIYSPTTNSDSNNQHYGALTFSEYSDNSGNFAQIRALSNLYTTWGTAIAFVHRDSSSNISEAMRIDRAGNVGINTTGPGVKLDVSGALRSTAITDSTIGAGYVMSDGSGNLYNGGTNVGNADTVDGQNFVYANWSNGPTYVWGTDTNGTSYLASRANLSVNYANSAGSAGSAPANGGTATYATYLNPLSGDGNYKLAYTADSARVNAGEWGRAVMYYVPNGQTYGIRVDRADYANSAGSAPASGGNADTTDGQNFSWSNRNDNPTYLWGADSNGDSYLASRANMSVNYANSAGSATNATNATNASNADTTDNQHLGTGNSPTFANVYLTPTGAFDYWGGGSAYRTWMDNNSTYYFGSVQDYAIHFTMDAEDSGRGFTWGAQGSRPNMSVDVNGNLSLAGNVSAAGFIYNSSDVSLKKNIETIQDPLGKIMKLRGVTFNWKKDNTPAVGLIAQEVETVYPELVAGTDGNKEVAYSNLVAPLIEAVKAQQKEIEDLKAQQTELMDTLAQNSTQLKASQNSINTLSTRLKTLEAKSKKK